MNSGAQEDGEIEREGGERGKRGKGGKKWRAWLPVCLSVRAMK